MLAAVMAILCMTGAMPAVTSSASYDPCDVNHDGAVDILDSIAINHHLAGTKYYLEYNQLDANQSHTVDSADATCVLNATINASYSACYIRQYGNGYMEPVTMPAVSSTVTLDSSANQTNSRSYIGYSYLTGEDIQEYELTVTTATLNTTQNSQARGLINGDDNRVVAHGYENTGIVRIAENKTGFIVGDHEIATAGHCVYDGDNDEFITDLEIYTYDRTGYPDGGTLNIAEIHMPVEYTLADVCLYDYALIVVKEDLSELGYVQFDIGNAYNMTYSEVNTIPIHLTGQPDELKDPDTGKMVTDWDNKLYTHNGSVYGNDNTSLFNYTVDATSGQSGSPVYTITRERYNNTDYYSYTVLSIHSRGGTVHNMGPLMTKHHLLFYGGNPYTNYE